MALSFGATAKAASQFSVDTFFGLSAGRFIVTHGLPQHNVVTWINHGGRSIDEQWLGHTLLYGAWRIAGDRGVALLSIGTATSTFALLCLLMMRRGVRDRLACVWTVVAVFICWPNTAARAQTFAFPLFVIVVWLLVDDDDGPRLQRRTLLVIPLLILWANIHGSVVAGAGIVAVYAVTRSGGAVVSGDRRGASEYLAFAAAAAATIVITPYGLEVLTVFRRTGADGRIFARVVNEWAPASINNPACWGFLLLAAAIGGMLLARWRKRTAPSLALTLVLIATTAAGFRSIRFEIWLALLAPAVLATRSVAPNSPADDSDTMLRRLLCGVVVAFALLMAGRVVTSTDTRLEHLAPLSAIDAAARQMDANPSVRVIGDEMSATALLWRDPRSSGRVAFDVGYQHYEAAQLIDMFRFMNPDTPRWNDTLNDYDLAIASKQIHPDLARRLEHLPGWTILASDNDGIAIARDPTR